ncbi:phage tail tube protein [Anaplasma bovis]|uniref:phage tail tube protein n=1 Tax=Anaplasma bovis TaxID=186733 RepID=UPI002FEF97B4
MISFSFKEDKSAKYLTLQDIKSVRFALHNRNSNTKDTFSDGWNNCLPKAGNKHIIFKVNGISCGSHAERILRECAFSNASIDCALSSSFHSNEVIHAKCFVELYEKFYEVGDLEIFSVVLMSSGIVNYSYDVR